MITTQDKPAYAIVAVIQTRSRAPSQGKKISLANITAGGGSTLAHELRSGQILPQRKPGFHAATGYPHLPRLGGNDDIVNHPAHAGRSGGRDQSHLRSDDPARSWAG